MNTNINKTKIQNHGFFSTPKKTSFPSQPKLSRKPRGTGDRFIPSRESMNIQISHLNVTHENPGIPLDTSPSKEQYIRTLHHSLFHQSSPQKILKFKSSTFNEAKRKPLLERPIQKNPPTRQIPKTPEKVLDAPDIRNDYYLNLLDWSKQNVLAVALDATLYLWNATDGLTSELCTLPNNTYISSVSWISDGDHIAIGTSSNDIQIWDPLRKEVVMKMDGHNDRVSSLSSFRNILSSGSRDSTIINHDLRVPLQIISTFEGHTQEVCGLKWSPDGSKLASGANDNLLNIWELSTSSRPMYRMEHHTAAVKALDWCPWQSNLLVSGGGTADRYLRFWNTNNGACINAIDTRSQVCSVIWSKNRRELISSHGFAQNQLTIWRYPDMGKVVELSGHTSRVLHMAMSPDGSTVVSAAADETLRFWKVFNHTVQSPLKSVKQSKASRSFAINIR